jgi:hypothetical protein
VKKEREKKEKRKRKERAKSETWRNNRIYSARATIILFLDDSRTQETFEC